MSYYLGLILRLTCATANVALKNFALDAVQISYNTLSAQMTQNNHASHSTANTSHITGWGYAGLCISSWDALILQP